MADKCEDKRNVAITRERPSPAVFSVLVAHAKMMRKRKIEEHQNRSLTFLPNLHPFESHISPHIILSASQQELRAEAERRMRAEKLANDTAALESVNAELISLQEEYSSLDAKKHDLFAQLKRALSEADAKRKKLEQMRQQQKKDEMEVLSRIGTSSGQGPSYHSPRTPTTPSSVNAQNRNLSTSSVAGQIGQKRARSPSVPNMAHATGAGGAANKPPPPPPRDSPRRREASVHSHSTPNYRSPYHNSSPSSNPTASSISSPSPANAGSLAPGSSPLAPGLSGACPLPPPPPAPSKNLLQEQGRQMLSAQVQHGKTPASGPSSVPPRLPVVTPPVYIGLGGNHLATPCSPAPRYAPPPTGMLPMGMGPHMGPLAHRGVGVRPPPPPHPPFMGSPRFF